MATCLTDDPLYMDMVNRYAELPMADLMEKRGTPWQEVTAAMVVPDGPLVGVMVTTFQMQGDPEVRTRLYPCRVERRGDAWHVIGANSPCPISHIAPMYGPEPSVIDVVVSRW